VGSALRITNASQYSMGIGAVFSFAVVARIRVSYLSVKISGECFDINQNRKTEIRDNL
jgi:hypothetical protein